MEFMCIENSLRFREIYDLGVNYFYGSEEASFGAIYDLTCTSFGGRGIFVFYAKTTHNDVVVWSEDEGKQSTEKSCRWVLYRRFFANCRVVLIKK